MSFLALLVLSYAQVVAPQIFLLTAERRWQWCSPWQEVKSIPFISWLQEDLLRPTAALEAQPVGSGVLAVPSQKQNPPGLTFPKLSFHWQKS